MKAGEELMMKLKELLMQPACVFPANIVSVNEAAMTCVVQPLNDDVPMTDVRLKAAIDNVTDGVVEIPVVGSTVLICLIGNDENTAFVIKCSNVSKVIMYGGTNGGLVNWPAVKAELDKTNQVVNALVQSLTGWTTVPSDGGAALKVYATAQLAAKSVGDYSSKEDTKVLH